MCAEQVIYTKEINKSFFSTVHPSLRAAALVLWRRSNPLLQRRLLRAKELRPRNTCTVRKCRCDEIYSYLYGRKSFLKERPQRFQKPLGSFYSYGPNISFGKPGARIQESQPVLPPCAGGGGFSNITRIRLKPSPIAPSHWSQVRFSPSQR